MHCVVLKFCNLQIMQISSRRNIWIKLASGNIGRQTCVCWGSMSAAYCLLDHFLAWSSQLYILFPLNAKTNYRPHIPHDICSLSGIAWKLWNELNETQESNPASGGAGATKTSQPLGYDLVFSSVSKPPSIVLALLKYLRSIECDICLYITTK